MNIILTIITVGIVVYAFVIANRTITIIKTNEKRINELERFFSVKVIDSIETGLEHNLHLRWRIKRLLQL